jgi:hypothetical protein
MAWLLDLVAIAAVVLAVVFLLRPKRGGSCADCAPAQPATRGGKRSVAETRISVDTLRATARRGEGGRRRCISRGS